MLDSVLSHARDAVTTAAVRAALIGGSLASGSLFWVRATLGQNQLTMHDCTRDGRISIGGVSEQLYGEGFIAAWHEVLSERLLPEEVAETLYDMGERGARWEVRKAIESVKVHSPPLDQPVMLPKPAAAPSDEPPVKPKPARKRAVKPKHETKVASVKRGKNRAEPAT